MLRGIAAPWCGSGVCIGKGAETNCLYLFQLTHTATHSHMNIANNILLSKQTTHSFYHGIYCDLQKQEHLQALLSFIIVLKNNSS